MKKKLYYSVILIVIFLMVLAGLVIVQSLGKDKEKRTVTLMSEAVLPVVYSGYEDIKINPLRGYLGDMDIMAMRDTLTPLGEDRQLRIYIYTFGTGVNKISYEIRTLDLKRILENTTLNEWEIKEDEVTAVLPIENLLVEGEEYKLTIKLELDDGRVVSYYTRIIWGLEDVYDKITYVKDFNRKTFDKEEANDLVRYLESGAAGDNTNYGHVNIYSSFQQITWGNLDVDVIGDVDISLKEVNGNISYFSVEYYVNIKNMYSTAETYKVTEFYRTRHTDTRTYLLNFERTMEQYFKPVSENIYASRINLGITEDVNIGKIEADESPSGKRVCFVRNGELWQYYSEENNFTKVFSFVSEEDIRTRWDRHDIKIADIDNDGNITFIVYGYMNRGLHEGRVGISICRYLAAEDAVDELAYIPYDKSYSLLEKNIGDVCYVNSSNCLFFAFGEKLYSIDLSSREYIVIMDGLEEGDYITNSEGNTIVWQVGDDNLAKELKILNLDTSKEKSITCSENEFIQLIGYMEGDIVYGITHKEDIATDALGDYGCYMHKLCIIDENKIQVGSYEKDNVYIKEAIICDGMITLNRFEKNENGEFVPIVVDYLTRNVAESKSPLSVDVVVTELKKKEIWMNITGTKGDMKLVTSDTESIYFEGNKEVVLPTDPDISDKYYVYTKAQYCNSFDSIADAIGFADEEYGIVTDYEGRYIWKRGNAYSSRTITGVSLLPDENNTLAACIDALFLKEGVTIASKSLLEKGETVSEIFSELGGYDCLYLYGVDIRQILYFINDGRTVIGKLAEDEYVLITGYDNSNITVFSARTGKSSKMKIETVSEQFMENGNIFISYLEQ